MGEYNAQNHNASEKRTYLVGDIAAILGIGKSSAYVYVVYKSPQNPCYTTENVV